MSGRLVLEVPRRTYAGSESSRLCAGDAGAVDPAEGVLTVAVHALGVGSVEG